MKDHKESNCKERTYPMVSPQPRRAIEQENIARPEIAACGPQRSSDEPDAKIAQNDIFSILRFEIWSVAAEVEVAPLPPLDRTHPRQREVV